MPSQPMLTNYAAIPVVSSQTTANVAGYVTFHSSMLWFPSLKSAVEHLHQTLASLNLALAALPDPVPHE